MIIPLEWDTNFFGIKTGKLDAEVYPAEEFIARLKTLIHSEFQLIYVFAPHNDTLLKKEIFESGGNLYDEKVTYSLNLSGFSPEFSSNIHSCKGTEMDNDLEALAIESGKFSRFRTDPKIPKKKFEDLYRLWMKNSLSGTFAKEVFAYEEDRKKLGMISIDIRQGEGWIGIIAVNETYRGRAIGKLLVHSVIKLCQDNKVGILNVQTQKENIVSCTFYEKIGFSVNSIKDVYHLWKKM
jgi:dTDP-4-amino-4,6-dideoxy-D-galactose acyltransferase